MSGRTCPPDVRRASASKTTSGLPRAGHGLRVLAAILLLATAPAAAADAFYPVSGFTLRYATEIRGLPDLADLAGIEVELGHDGEAYVASRPGIERVAFHLGRVPDAPQPLFRTSALRSVGEQLVAALEAHGLSGLRVHPDPRDIDPESAADVRGSFTRLRLVLSVARVAEVNAYADPGDASASELERIRERSPLQPGAPLREGELRAYLARLSRDSGRHVVAQLRPSAEAGEVALEYRVFPERPWSAWLQVSNTGTEATTRWRERLGMARRRLASEDDALSLDYVTGDFDSVHAATGSYEAPLASLEGWRWRLDGSWSRFDSSQLGVDEAFSGEQWDAGAQLQRNLFQHENLFVDGLIGLRYQEVQTRDRLSGLEGDSQFVLPRIGLRLQHASSMLPAHATLALERSLPSAANADAGELQRMGRAGVDERFQVLRFDGGLSLFPASWLPHAASGDASSLPRRLAHELALSVGGQHAFGARLIPYHQRTLGGLYSVRGYPQSISAGDTVLRSSAEYRLHVSRLLGSSRGLPGREGSEVLLRAFVDAGRALQSERLPDEAHETLLGVGLGVELRFGMLRLRFDWGRALEALASSGVDSGDSAYHAVASLLY